MEFNEWKYRVLRLAFLLWNRRRMLERRQREHLFDSRSWDSGIWGELGVLVFDTIVPVVQEADLQTALLLMRHRGLAAPKSFRV